MLLILLLWVWQVIEEVSYKEQMPYASMLILLVQLEEVFAHAIIQKDITSKKEMQLRPQTLQSQSLTHVLRLHTELVNKSLEPHLMNVGGTKQQDLQDLT